MASSVLADQTSFLDVREIGGEMFGAAHPLVKNKEIRNRTCGYHIVVYFVSARIGSSNYHTLFVWCVLPNLLQHDSNPIIT